jgi:hypothetical protein
MAIYRTKAKKLPGTDFHEVRKKAFAIYQRIKRRTKRRPYVRSSYFKKDKIFLAPFWHHLFDKKWQDRLRRLQYYEAAIELIRHNRFEPQSKENPNKRGEVLHRFVGRTSENEIFFVQIKEDKRTGNKYLISMFPEI